MKRFKDNPVPTPTGEGVETNKEQPTKTRYLVCTNPTGTLTKGKRYEVIPLRKRVLGRGWYYCWHEFISDRKVNAKNVQRLKVVNNNGVAILVSPDRFDTTNLLY